MVIRNRYDFMFFVEAANCNPNGDPDMGNMPRMYPDTMIGYMTDVCQNRRIRDYIDAAHTGKAGMNIFVQKSVNLNRLIAEAKELAGYKLNDKNKAAIGETALKLCSLYWDVRAFGGVMSTAVNGGQVLGPVQIDFAKSLDPIHPIESCITRCASADDVDGAKTAADYAAAEAKADENKLRTMGRKWHIPFGLYVATGHISANVARNTGFDDEDAEILFEAIANACDCNHTSSKNLSVVGPVIIFKHVGEENLPAEERANRALLGCAGSKSLFRLVTCHKKDGVDVPMSVDDYDCSINLSALPSGVKVGFRAPFALETMWGQLPAGEKWMQTT